MILNIFAHLVSLTMVLGRATEILVFNKLFLTNLVTLSRLGHLVERLQDSYKFFQHGTLTDCELQVCVIRFRENGVEIYRRQ